MSVFRILHLSDLHVSVVPSRGNNIESICSRFGHHFDARNVGTVLYPSTFDPDIFELLSKWLYLNRDEADIALVSGDIAATGMNDDVDSAFSFIDSPAASIWLTHDGLPTLALGGVPTTKDRMDSILVMPGNHDRYSSRSGAAGCGYFDSKFGSYWPSGFNGVHHRVLVKDEDRLAIVMADFCLCTNADAPGVLGFLGMGRAHEHVVTNLRLMTESIRRKDKGMTPVLWVLHFPPLDDLGSLELLDHIRVLDAAEEEGVRLILGGHLHEVREDNEREIRILSAGSGSAMVTRDGNWAHILDVDVQKGRIVSADRRHFGWDQKVGDFVQMDPTVATHDYQYEVPFPF